MSFLKCLVKNGCVIVRTRAFGPPIAQSAIGVSGAKDLIFTLLQSARKWAPHPSSAWVDRCLNPRKVPCRSKFWVEPMPQSTKKFRAPSFPLCSAERVGNHKSSLREHPSAQNGCPIQAPLGWESTNPIVEPPLKPQPLFHTAHPIPRYGQLRVPGIFQSKHHLAGKPRIHLVHPIDIDQCATMDA